MQTYEWDERKDQTNQRKHGISFAEAISVFDDPAIITIFDEGHSHDEDRWVSLGRTTYGIVCVVCHTFRTSDGLEHIRIISARQATKREESQYYSL